MANKVKFQTMLYDKQQPYNRPTAPLMQAPDGSNRVGRSPLTPRLAGSTTSPKTPLYRPSIPAQKGPNSNRNQPKSVSTPPKPFLSANITPRSTARKARVDSANTTPNNTPNGAPARPRSTIARPASTTPTQGTDSSFGSGLRGHGSGTKRRPASVISDSKSAIGSASPETPCVRGLHRLDTVSTFFYANDIKTSAETSPVSAEKPHVQSKTSKFVYANGNSLQPELDSPSIYAPASLRGSSSAESPNDSPISACKSELQRSEHFQPEHPLDRRPMSSPRLVAPGQEQPCDPIALLRHDDQRIVSFCAEGNAVLYSPATRTPSLLAGVGSQDYLEADQDQGAVQTSNPSNVALENARQEGHNRSASVGSLVHNSSRRQTVGSSSTSSSPPVNHSKHASLPMAAVAWLNSEHGRGFLDMDSVSVASTSPGATTDSASKRRSQNLSERAMNARIERKIMDLEISNSSLMAINRTLEKEMRKQNNELRRFRRLSRSGRLSLASSAIDLDGDVMAGLAGNPAQLDLSDMSEEDDDDEEDRSEKTLPSEEEDSAGDGSLSPGAMAASDARHRDKDEQRLRLDLAKHQRLLVDSQKMNQSLKRCLNWTDELIRDGKKALAFQVRLSEIGFGGRVLSMDDHDDDSQLDERVEVAHDFQTEGTCSSLPRSTNSGHEGRISREFWGAGDGYTT